VTSSDCLKTGTVLLYPFLWSHEYRIGEESGRKDRPVAVAFNIGHKIGLVPITSKAPRVDECGIEIPEIEKQRAGLDVTKRLWVIPTEMNIDDPINSYYLEPDAIVGQFSAVFMEKLKAEIKLSIARVAQVPRR
jgi:hypothetical protein